MKELFIGLGVLCVIEGLTFAAFPQAMRRAMEAALEHSENSLEETMRDFPPEKLGDGERSYYHIAHGIVQHNLYHAGQIALLKKYKS